MIILGMVEYCVTSVTRRRELNVSMRRWYAIPIRSAVAISPLAENTSEIVPRRFTRIGARKV